jgi:DNA-binding CsgD family transcriptional regulator
MVFDGYLILYFCALLLSTVVLTVSLILYILLKESWRLYFILFVGAATLFLCCDGLLIAFGNGPSLLLMTLIVLMCSTAVLMIPLLLKLYRFGLRFVLMRWEKRFLFLILIPVIYLTAAAFLYFSVEALPLYLIIITYCSAMGIVMYLLSSKRTQKRKPDENSLGEERELVFFLLTTIVLLPLELLEYVYKIFRNDSHLFPMYLLITPLFLIETALFFTLTGFLTIKRMSSFRKQKSMPFNLTEREKEVSLLITEGLTHKEIAVKLFISQRTVDRHVENIYRKCGAKNKADFIRSVIVPI